ncbi:MAG: hypothetical protein EBY45_16805, partial [Gammaproteobacteria bacterium]|nr:hypothetical protein [Gammaproteobacteria bacterium]
RDWANAAEARYNDVVYVVNHWIYGMVMPGHFDIYYGRAINQTVRAAASVALGADVAAQVIDDATKSINALGWRCGAVFLDAVLARAYLRSGDGDQALSRAKAATSDSIKAECHDFTWRIDMITGDALMSINALWTAAKYEIPALMVIANNRSYFNDEIHQQKVAEKRDRNVENRWVGQRIDDPTPDIAQLAKGLGVEAIGPVETRDDLVAAMQQAVAAVRAGKPFLVDVVIESNIGREAEVARQEKRK